MHIIKNYSFNEQTSVTLTREKYGNDWPVVYIIDNNVEAYVGETLDASVRSAQHWQNPERQKLTQINLITDDDYNKSVILDLEAFLIKHMSADEKFILQNGNMGLHLHNYYNRAEYQKQFPLIWNDLKAKNLVSKSIDEIENSEIFKFSPYNSLSTDQYAAVAEIIKALAEAITNKTSMTAIVNGGPGTGKTVLAIYLMKLLMDKDNLNDIRDSEDDESIATISENIKKLPSDMRIGFVVPMQSLRTTLQDVFKKTSGLNAGMVIKPTDLATCPDYDLLVVDESHRLRRRKALSQYPDFDKANEALNLGQEGTELDWILAKSKYQILFYDKYQSVKPSDVEPERFEKLLNRSTTKSFALTTQFRCKGGDRYISYARDILSDNNNADYEIFRDYDFRLFTDCGEMTAEIKRMDNEYRLCRTVAGYAWRWASKNDKNAYDIELDGNKYRWNTVDKDWVNHKGSIDEIGCIHTIQGYDLNYCAVIFGREIDYDFEHKCFVVNKSNYMDNPAKSVGNDKQALKEYVLNIYKTLMTRGIRGTFVYACNKNLREYLKKYVQEYKK